MTAPRIRPAIAGLLIVLVAVLAGPALACSPSTDCPVGERSYRIAMPAGHDGTTPVGAIVFAHGYLGSAEGTMADPGLRALADHLGVALVAVEAADGDWDIPNAPRLGPEETGEDELAYFDAVLADVTDRFPVDPERILAAGFSSGGMMTWVLACRRGDSFMGFAPIAGTFWAPVPERCPDGPVSLVHVHGTDDEVVPLAGRPVADTRQGDVFEAVELMRSTGFGEEAIEVGYQDRRCARWRVPDGPAFLDFCRHPGGHVFSPEDVGRAYRLMAGAS